MGNKGVIYLWNLWYSALLVGLQIKNAESGLPTPLRRLIREIYPEIESDSYGNLREVCILGDVVYAAGETVPAEQPCLKCKCQPPGVQCDTIKCANKIGCKTIHRPNNCCPDYQCECYYEDRIYANGERLQASPGGECNVCYCRGGEIQCTEVSCYVRTDCEAKSVPGQCCPKYDHCPPKGSAMEGFVSAIAASNASSLNTSEAENKSTIIQQETQTISNKVTVKQDITIEEIIPHLKEIPATDSSFGQSQSQLVNEEFKNLINNSMNDVIVTDSEADSSEISEVFQQPPPILRIGDKLLFLKQGTLIPEKDVSTPASVITIIGAEGLQRGFEESAELQGALNSSEHSLFNNSNDLELKVSESTHILSLVKHKQKSNLGLTTTEKDTTTELMDSTTPFDNENEKPLSARSNFVESINTETFTLSPKNVSYTTIINLPPVVETSIFNNVSHGVNKSANTFNESVTVILETTVIPGIIEMKKNITEDRQLSTSNVLKPLNSNISLTMMTETVQQEERLATDVVTFLPNFERSIESLEETTEDSGENTTPKDNYVASISTENASIETTENENYETVDMMRSLSSSVESEIIEVTQNDSQQYNKKNPLIDVEFLNENNSKMITTKEVDTSTKSIGKRENSLKDEEDEVFKQLDVELNIDNTESTRTANEEKEESSKIFQELLDEISTPKSFKKVDKDTETLHRITDTVAKFAFRGSKSSDVPNILGLLSNVFNYQHRFARKK